MRYVLAIILAALSVGANAQEILLCIKYGKTVPGPGDTISCMHNKTDLGSGQSTTLAKLYKQRYRLVSFEIVPNPKASSHHSYIYYLDRRARRSPDPQRRTPMVK